MPARSTHYKPPHAPSHHAKSGDELAPGYLAGGGQMVGVGPAEMEVSRWQHAFSALHYPIYRALWIGALVSNIGSWMQTIARDWLIFDLSGHQATWLGYNAFAEGVPLVLLLPLGGVLADHLNRKWLLIITNTLSALTASLLAILAFTGTLRPWHILAISAFNGMLDAARIPAHQSLMPGLVAKRDLPNAVALNSLQFNLSRLTGPALGGLTFQFLGAVWSFGLNALSFLGIIFPLLRLKEERKSGGKSAHPRHLHAHFGEGLRFILSRSDLITMFSLIILAGLFTAPAMKMLPALALQNLHGDEGLFSLMLSCFGAGAVVGAVILAARSRRGPTPWRAYPALMALGLCQIVLGLSEQRWLTLIIIALAGGMFVGTMARLNTAILASTPDRFRGRTTSFHVISFRIGLPFGGLIAGGVAQATGIGHAFQWFGLALLAVIPLVALAARVFKVRYRELED